LKRDYAKEQLRENTGQSESKERDFKEYWSNVLKKTLEVRF
jgi:cephalosporin-C deacetylase-like acetyl esterase